jgi:Zn-dependent protease with chaperone function
VLNWINRKLASRYDSRGYERLEGEERDGLEELAGDDSPHEIWIGEGESRAWFGNVVISREDFELYGLSEIEAIFLHELGHVRDKAVYKMLLLFIIAVFTIAIVFLETRLFTTPMIYVVNLIGVSGVIPILIIGLLVVIFVVTSVAILLLFPALGLIYRRYEYSADKYATNRGCGEQLRHVLRDKQKKKIKVRELIRRGKLVTLIRSIFFYPSFDSRIERIRQNMDE